MVSDGSTSRGKLLLTVGFSWLCTLWWREGGREIDLPAGVLRLLWPVWKKAQSGEGEDRCHSAKDLFNKPLGLKLSLHFLQFCTTHPFKNMFCLLWLCLNACAEWRTGMCCILHYCCFHNLLKREGFSVLTLNLSFTHVCTSRIFVTVRYRCTMMEI